jgi:two-component system, LuxR family, response regulator FixJ
MTSTSLSTNGAAVSVGTVFVVDDEEPMRNALRRVMSASGLAVETFSSAQQFLESRQCERPGCILLDLQMPGMNGLELQQELRARGFALPIIFLTGMGTVTHAVSAMRGGAADFLEKPFENEALLQRVKTALEVDREALERDSQRQLLVQRVSTLTPRESSVLVLLSQGQSNKHVARKLNLSPRTVEGYRARIMEKLEAKSVAELVPIVQQCAELLPTET